MFPRSELLDMLTYCRPHDSGTREVFTTQYVRSLPNAETDKHHNTIVRVGTSSVLWSCHTDTVHRRGGRQTINVSADGRVTLSKRSIKHGSNCLGADDTIGVFLMRQMVNAGVPGIYVFHHAEEIGGQGSTALVRSRPKWLADVRYAIAFDRRNTGDVITHQSVGRTASDAFARSLADVLNASGLRYTPSDRGIYTDTAEYADDVPECTNISVGYANEHTTRESVDLQHVEKLLTALLAFDETALVCEREPGDWYDYSDVPPLRYVDAGVRDFSYITALPDCQWCCLAYVEDESDATEPDAFCSADCELRYYVDLNARRVQREVQRDYFLSDEYAAVQKALRNTTKPVPDLSPKLRRIK